MGMHKAFNEDYSGPVGTPTEGERFEQSYNELIQAAKDLLDRIDRNPNGIGEYTGGKAFAVKFMREAIAKAEAIQGKHESEAGI